MVIKLNNQSDKFYQYMGKFFGSRIVEKQINDRIYDDADKEWYIYVEKEEAKAFVSLQKDMIKNVYTTKDEELKEIIMKIRQDRNIRMSIVPKIYADIYRQCELQVAEQGTYKNFVVISEKVG